MSVSFGPFGRSKALCNITGGIITTKDGAQMLTHYLGNEKGFYRKYWLQQCMKHAESVGDGLMTTFITLNYVLNCIETDFKAHNSHHLLQTKRIQKLRSLETIIHIMKANHVHLTKIMVVNGIWRYSTDIHSLVRDICNNILVPACDFMTARSISDLMVCCDQYLETTSLHLIIGTIYSR